MLGAVEDSPGGARIHPITVVSIAIVACAAADLVHEALGHGIASWLARDPILSVSTVALQNAAPSRTVAAAGTAANVLVGSIALRLLAGVTRFDSRACFLWMFGAFNLFNSAYLIASALLGNGDWAAVIAGLAPTLAWRVALALVGASGYALALRATAAALSRFVERGELAASQVGALTLPAYLAGGVLMTLASVFNPISPNLILLSGVGASFGLNAGFLFLPGIVGGHGTRGPAPGRLSAPSLAWLGCALVVGAAFVALLGPGVRFASQQ
jgi:hypothetical protein